MFFLKIIFRFIINLTILLILNRFVIGFELTTYLWGILGAAVIFTLLNSYFRPLAKVVFAPLILITLGLFGLLINASTLYLLDIFSENITINGLMPLWQATLIITVFNVLVGIFL